MKFISQALLIALLAFSLGLYLPWWSIALASFAVAAFLGLKQGPSFLSGFIGGTLLWGGLSFFRSLLNEHILAKRFAPMVLGMDNPLLLIALTALLAGAVAGMGALTGSLFRRMVSPQATEP